MRSPPIMSVPSQSLLSRRFHPPVTPLHSHPHLTSAAPTPTATSKKTCLLLHLGACKSMLRFKQIQAQLFRSHLHHDKGALNKALLFCTDPHLGCLPYAERVFNHATQKQPPHLVSYNIIIKAFAKQGSFTKVLSLFHRLREDSLPPDNYTFPFVLKAAGCLGRPPQGSKLHGYVVKIGLHFDSYVCNSLMDMYALLGNAENARKLFDAMPERDVISWNSIISGYVRCRRFQDAVDVFRRMREEGNMRPDEATIASALTACVALKDLKLGGEIHHYVVKELGFTVIIGNALLDMYSKCGCLDIAREIFDGMLAKNVNCVTSLVSGYINSGRLDEARQLFDRSSFRDTVLWTAMINGYVQFNRFDEAVALFREMQNEKIKPDRFTVVALLTGCAQQGALEQGRWLHQYIDENGIVVDRVVATALIEMYAKCGFVKKSMEIFRGLKARDTASWTSIISALAMNGETAEALNLFTEMNQVGAKPDCITYIGVLSACNHGGLVDEACRHFHSMKKIFHIKPEMEHYGCMIDLLGRAGRLGEAEMFIQDVPKENKEIVVPLYGALLSACRIHGNVEMSEQIFKRLSEIEVCDSGVRTLLANVYASAGRWEEAKQVRKEMKALGVRKYPGCSSIEVNGVVHEFLVGDGSHPEMAEVCAMLNRITIPLLDLEESGTKGMNLIL